jgi:hypothetical protein
LLTLASDKQARILFLISAALEGDGCGKQRENTGAGCVTQQVDRAELLEIVHKDPELHQVQKIKNGGEYKFVRSLVFYTDGRGETNDVPTRDGAIAVVSTTAWDGKKLVTTYKNGRTQKVELELSTDRKTLTQKTYIKTQLDKFYILITYTRS